MNPQPDKARALLHEMMQSLRQAGDTPLQCGIDAPRIAARALERAGAPTGAQPIGLVLDWIVNGALTEPWPDGHGASLVEPAVHTDFGNPETGSSVGIADIVAWLERTHECLRTVHPWAPQILALRLEGETSREIAERLGLGLRLTQRITGDMQAALLAVAN